MTFKEACAMGIPFVVSDPLTGAYVYYPAYNCLIYEKIENNNGLRFSGYFYKPGLFEVEVGWTVTDWFEGSKYDGLAASLQDSVTAPFTLVKQECTCISLLHGHENACPYLKGAK